MYVYLAMFFKAVNVDIQVEKNVVHCLQFGNFRIVR